MFSLLPVPLVSNSLKSPVMRFGSPSLNTPYNNAKFSYGQKENYLQTMAVTVTVLLEIYSSDATDGVRWVRLRKINCPF